MRNLTYLKFTYRQLVAILFVVTLFSFAGCGEEDAGDTNQDVTANIPKPTQQEFDPTPAPFVCTPEKIANTPFADGEGSSLNPYRICTLAQFKEIENFLVGQIFLLSADIDFEENGSNFKFGDFIGTLDGGNHTVSNYHLDNRSLSGLAGLFTSVSGIIRNLNLADLNINGSESIYTGGLAATATDITLDNVHTSGVVVGNNSAGGLICKVTGEVIISNSSSSADITGGVGSWVYVGGLIGFNQILGGTGQIQIISSGFSGSISALRNSTGAGGIIGKVLGLPDRLSVISETKFTGKIVGHTYVGGLAGEAAYLKVSQSFSSYRYTQVVYIGDCFIYNQILTFNYRVFGSATVSANKSK